MSKFWCEAGEQPKEDRPVHLTYLTSVEEEKDGSKSVKVVVMEQVNSPLDTMQYTDFMLGQCIKNGVSYKSLNIPDDMRVGHESEMEAFETRFVELENQYNSNHK